MIEPLIEHARDKSRFLSIEAYFDFAEAFLAASNEFVAAQIICQNEPKYRFWQLGPQTGYAISRPINSQLMCSPDELLNFRTHVLNKLVSREGVGTLGISERAQLNKVIYTLQQSIGIALDGLNGANFARNTKSLGI